MPVHAACFRTHHGNRRVALRGSPEPGSVWPVSRGSCRNLFEFLECQLQLLGARDFVVPGCLISHERNALPFMGVGYDAAWLARLEGEIGEGLQQLRDVVAVHFSD